MKLNIGLFFIFIAFIPRAFAGIGIKHDISYSGQTENIRNLLDIYYPEDVSVPKDVLLFIHGGSWNSGKKETYWWLGKNMARKNVVSVIINYSLSPEAQFEQMAMDCALAIKWVKENIAGFGGKPDRIFVMGHSAGGHLAALINNDPRFFKKQGIPNPIKAVILNDGFGLDMFEYLTVAVPNKRTKNFLKTFSNDKELWKAGSPSYYLENVNNPYLIFIGERTYHAIKHQSDRLFKDLNQLNKTTEFKVIPRKKHVGMISQMVFRKNQMYAIILQFMKKYS